MTCVRNMPGRAKQQMLDFLKHRGGSLRCGHFDVWQMLYWRCFRKGSEGSTHEEVTTTRELILELEAEGKVILRQDDKGVCNYIALKSTDGPDEVTKGELSNSELEELLTDAFLQYSYIEKRLANTQKDYEAAVQLAAQSEENASRAREEGDAAKSELAELQKTASFDGARKILDEQETELANARKDKRIADLKAEELSAEVKRLSSKLEKAESDNISIRSIQEILQKKVDELTAELKSAHTGASEKIAELKSELTKVEKGEGLTAAKAVAAAVSGLDVAIDASWERIVETIVESCTKYLPEEKRCAFREEVHAAHKKMQRRQRQ